MNSELSLATSITRSAGRSARNPGIIARTPWDTSSGFAVAWRITPTEMASRPLSRTRLRSSAGPSSTRATSRMRTGKPLTVRITMAPNCAGVLRSGCEVTLNSRKSGDAQGKGVEGGDHDGAELRRRAQIGLRGDAELALLRFDAASGQSQVAAADRVLHIPGV